MTLRNNWVNGEIFGASDINDISNAVSAVGALTPVTVKTGTYAAGVAQIIPCDATSAPFTVTLPAAPTDGTTIVVKKIDTSTNIVTVATAGSDVFNKAGGSTSLQLKLKDQACTVQYSVTAAIWYVISDDQSLTQLDARYYAPGGALGTPASGTLTNCTFPTFNQNTSGSAAKLTTARTIDGQSFDGSANITVIAPGTHAASSKTTPVDNDELPLADSASSYVLGKLTWANLKATLATYFAPLTQALTNKDLTSGTNTFPTFNQNTSGSAAKWTTARNLAGNSVDGSGNVAFANKFIVQGTTDSGLSAAQFTGALGTGLVKNTTTTGVLSIAASGTDYAPATSGSGVLKGNGAGGTSAATAGTDFVAPSGALGTPSSGTLTNCGSLPVSGITASTSAALGVGSIELGHASDTTLSRASAGVLAVEGVNVLLNSGALGTPASGTLTNCGSLPVSGITASTSTAIGVGSINLGHASDTNIARSSAGVITVASVVVPTISSTNTFTNKRNTARVYAYSAPGATPTINTDNYDVVVITALAAAITSMTTNLTGTPNDGDKLLLRFTDNGTARAITWGAKFGSSGIATLLATTVISKVHNVGLVWDATKALWMCMAVDATGY